MPRIDPIQLLNCLGVLLSPHGGIKSQDEVQRLAKLMIKFSKKLVSKCIYIQILKCTETDLLGLFMGSGGWRLVHMWLTESIVSNNWPLVKELLELLLLCPVDIDQLKTNNCPKLVKGLSKEGNHFAIRALASKLVEQWLKTVKGEPVIPLNIQDIPQIVTDAETEINLDSVKSEPNLDIENADIKHIEATLENDSKIEISESIKPEKIKEDDDKESTTLPVLKITLKDGKQIISQVDDGKSSKESHTSKSKDRSHDKSSSSRSSSSKHSRSKSHSSSSDKHRSSSSSRKSSSSSSKSKDKEKSGEREKDKESSSSSKSHKHSDSSSRRSSSSSSSSKSKDGSSKHSSDKDKIKDRHDKSKDSSIEKSDKLQTPSIQKLGKIPKLSDAKREKPSISIEVRKPDEPKPKTVKTFHSKFRKHGLEEESKPPPSRAAILSNKKPPPPLPPTVSIPKRPSPVHNEPPPEKKPKTIEPIDKPGSIKLIPPKPKRLHQRKYRKSSSRINSRIGRFFAGAVMLLESDMFMDALTASATNKKEPKKRKRRTSGSKDGHGEGSPTHAPSTPSATSPSAESKSVPPRFYQDTLDNDENKDNKETPTDSHDKSNDVHKDDDSMDTVEPHTLTINGLKGVLCYHKRKGPKKSIKWRPDSELEEIQYFELDETERVNVTKTFTDMKHLERIHEREAFEKGRNIPNDDVMEEKTSWRPLIPIDVEGQVVVEYGKLSKERDIQAMRQKGTLQPLYFHKSMIPDSGLEPDPETHTYSEPVIIPLEDVTGNQDNISDFRNMPWPEPKGNAPPLSSNPAISNNMFPPNMAQFPNGFPPAQFPGMPPGFQPPNIGPGDWPNGVPNMLPGPMNPMVLPPGTMPPGNMPPGLMVSPEELMMAEMFGAPNPMFGVPPDGFNMQQGMFPMDFGMAGPQGPPGPDSFPGPGNFRGAMRGRGSNGHWRGKGPGNWDGPQRGKGGPRGGRKTVCIYFQRKGSCRQGDNCTFLHPGVHCPY